MTGSAGPGVAVAESGGAQVRASAVVAATAGLAGARTTPVDVRNHVGVDWIVYLTDVGLITRLDMLIDWSEKEAPDVAVAADWAQVQVENIVLATGLSDLVDYAPRFAITVARTLGVSAPARGRWMRLRLWIGVGTATTSMASVNAYRRAV